MASYRKTRNGEWVAYGTPDAIVTGRVITITKRSGETEDRLVQSVGKTFTTPEGLRCYGYLAPRAPQPVLRINGVPQTNRYGMCDECGQRRATTTAVDMSGIPGHVCGRCARDGALSFA